YHDLEWGVPIHDDRLLFEFLVLEGAQAGLSWLTVLRKRTHFRQAFDHFDPAVVAGYGEHKISELLSNPGIIRNRRKIEAAVHNARAFLSIQAEFGSFDAFIWQFTAGKTIHNTWRSLDEIPSSSLESEAMSRAMKSKGFKFVGPTICYAHMQATGMVNDHLVDCFRHSQLVSGERGWLENQAEW
ncbi:MAG: DNA-3-methyladenine glycosylase I, partial [Anaerolineales bacterium]